MHSNKVCTIVQVHLLHPQSKIHWKKCADMPVEMSAAQAVAIGDEVFVGGGIYNDKATLAVVLKYNTVNDEWAHLPNHCTTFFGMCCFQGELLSVGGSDGDNRPTNKVYLYSTANGEWVESLRPMPTKRTLPALLTTASAIISCGGETAGEDGERVAVATVEVYSSSTSQWHTADSLPQPRVASSSVAISGCGFFLGGSDIDPIRSVFCVDMATLIDRAASSTRHHDTTSTWKTLPDTPLAGSAAATLSGGLLAMGGDDNDDKTQQTVHVFIPSTHSWVKLLSGDLPVERYESTAVQLSNNRVMVMGGADNDGKDTSTCYISSTVI